jgi:hypothetical protein
MTISLRSYRSNPAPAAAGSSVAAPRVARWFYVGMGVAMLGTIVAGFAPSFFLRPATMPSLAPRVIAHGTLFSSWIVLFVVQASLVAAGRTRLHRDLGVAAAGLAALMVVSGPPMALALAGRGQPAGDPLAFMLVILVDLMLFAAFVGAAIWKRRSGETHKRLMLLATISMLPPAISRWPIAVRNPAPVIMGVLLVLLAAAPACDLLTRRRVQRMSLWGGLVILASMPLRFAVAHSAWWHHVASALVR